MAYLHALKFVLNISTISQFAFIFPFSIMDIGKSEF